MRTLVITMAGIGDSLMSLNVLHELCKKNKETKVDVLVLWKTAKDILESQKERIGINKIYQIDCFNAGIFKSLIYFLRLRKNKYDSVINLAPQARIHYDIVNLMIGGSKKITFDYQKGFLNSLFKKIFFDEVKLFSYKTSVIKQNLELIKSDAKPRYDFEMPSLPDFPLYKKINRLRGKKIGIHIGSGTTKNLYLKRWPNKKWEELILSLVKNKNNVLLFGKQEISDNKTIRDNLAASQVHVIECENILETIQIIKQCDLFISADSLFMHIAAALNKKQIILAGPALDKTIMPLNNNKKVVSLNLKCMPCYRYGENIRCTNNTPLQCIREIFPEIVLNEINKLLKKDYPKRNYLNS